MIEGYFAQLEKIIHRNEIKASSEPTLFDVLLEIAQIERASSVRTLKNHSEESSS